MKQSIFESRSVYADHQLVIAPEIIPLTITKDLKSKPVVTQMVTFEKIRAAKPAHAGKKAVSASYKVTLPTPPYDIDLQCYSVGLSMPNSPKKIRQMIEVFQLHDKTETPHTVVLPPCSSYAWVGNYRYLPLTHALNLLDLTRPSLKVLAFIAESFATYKSQILARFSASADSVQLLQAIETSLERKTLHKIRDCCSLPELLSQLVDVLEHYPLITIDDVFRNQTSNKFRKFTPSGYVKNDIGETIGLQFIITQMSHTAPHLLDYARSVNGSAVPLKKVVRFGLAGTFLDEHDTGDPFSYRMPIYVDTRKNKLDFSGNPTVYFSADVSALSAFLFHLQECAEQEKSVDHLHLYHCEREPLTGDADLIAAIKSILSAKQFAELLPNIHIFYTNRPKASIGLVDDGRGMDTSLRGMQRLISAERDKLVELFSQEGAVLFACGNRSMAHAAQQSLDLIMPGVTAALGEKGHLHANTSNPERQFEMIEHGKDPDDLFDNLHVLTIKYQLVSYIADNPELQKKLYPIIDTLSEEVLCEKLGLTADKDAHTAIILEKHDIERLLLVLHEHQKKSSSWLEYASITAFSSVAGQFGTRSVIDSNQMLYGTVTSGALSLLLCYGLNRMNVTNLTQEDSIKLCSVSMAFSFVAGYIADELTATSKGLVP